MRCTTPAISAARVRSACARSSRFSGTPTAATSASSTCTSRTWRCGGGCRAEMEPIRNRPEFDRDKKHRILAQLIDAELFESFTHGRYQGQKRFSLEGAESLIPAIHQFMETAAETGAEEVVMGMAHRGRLNVLANIFQKPYSMIFHEFEDNVRPDPYGGDGDVKYHRGFSSDYRTTSGAEIHISLTANPSHLEAVDPVVEGRTRAKQRRRDDTATRTKVLPLLIHGDAAFAGQGLVAETLNLSQLKGYATGGTVHIVVNNQIGFHHPPRRVPLDPLSDRYREDGRGADLPRQRRRSGSRARVCRRSRTQVSPGVRARRGRRHGLLPQARPQRGRRARLHPAADVPEDPQPAVDPRDLPARAGGRPRHYAGGDEAPAHELPPTPAGFSMPSRASRRPASSTSQGRPRLCRHLGRARPQILRRLRSTPGRPTRSCSRSPPH